MKQNHTWEVNQKRLGRFHDWVAGGTPGAYIYGDEGAYYNMPINQSNAQSRKGGQYKTGGPWLAYIRTAEYGGDDTPIYRPSWGQAFSGPTRVTYNKASFLLSEDELHIMHKDLWEKGAEAWAAMRPAQPDFSLATSVYELRELPAMYRTRVLKLLKEIKDEKKRIRNASKRIKSRNRRRNEAIRGNASDDGVSIGKATGDMHLAVQFGWIPLLSDILGFAETFNHKHKLLDQLIRDEGRPIKRRRKISSPEPSSEFATGKYNTSYSPSVYPKLVTQCYVSNRYKGWWERTHTVDVQTWAEGKFRYYLPSGPRTEGWKREMYRRIMGGRITPAALYQIMPWSWLADYFTDLGSFLEATSDGVEENLYCEYAYVMRTVEIKRHWDIFEGIHYNVGGNGKFKKSSLTLKDHVKMRVNASPFGFGLKETDLSLKQVSILGALGLSKLG